MKNIERMLSNCGITYEVLPENDSLNKLAKSLRKKIIFDMLKDERIPASCVVGLLIAMVLSFVKGYPVLSFVTIVFVIIIVPVQLILIFKYIKDVKNLYKNRAFYKLLISKHNTDEFIKEIYNNSSRTAYKTNGKPYMKNQIYTYNSNQNNCEIILITFGNCNDLSKVPMMIADM